MKQIVLCRNYGVDRVTPAIKPGCGLKPPKGCCKPVAQWVTPAIKPGCGLKRRFSGARKSLSAVPPAIKPGCGLKPRWAVALETRLECHPGHQAGVRIETLPSK